ncbi:hypothetical protein GCM10025778_15910 [Paeniglutamicibacter antarcticus]|uniref:Transposase IS116/IS110/IS902 C-terminal domain-containing protein n=1 Tax=Paeniglutamicibacter antarcticus TaxID=494023 RepID=A0ABP9TLG9_9MICC
MAKLLAKYPTPAALRRAGEAHIGALLRKYAPRAWKGWAHEIIAALAAQTVVVSGTEAAGIVLPGLARMLSQNRTARANVLKRVEELVTEHPLHLMLDSMPGVGIRTEPRILTEVTGKDFATAGHLASYTGLAPVTWRSGTSIRGDHSSRKGNKVLKRALFLSAFASLKCRD